MKSFLKNPPNLFHLQALLVIITFGLTIFAFPRLPGEIPLWYTHPWGIPQLAKRIFLFVIPTISLIILATNSFLLKKVEKLREFEIVGITKTVTTLILSILLFSTYRIINLSTNLFGTFNYDLITLLPPMLVSFIIAVLVTPFVIKLMKKLKIVDDPKIHQHPAILHTTPIPRGGSVTFLVSLFLSSLIFVGITKKVIGLLAGALVATIVGIIDDKFDIKNAKVKFFLMLPLPVLFIVGFGIGIAFFQNPFGDIIRLDTIDIPIYFLGEHHLWLLADLFAFFWLIWVMGMLGLSDGVDGQFSGIIGIASIIISILALRFVHFEPSQWDVARLGAIVTGASFGLLVYNWHPAKIHWGTGDWAASLVLGSLGILSGAKVATSILILLVPALDAIVTLTRRIVQKKSPLKGDRGHLHHRLLDLGWDQRAISVFYWILTSLLGVVALFSSGKTKLLSILTLGGLFGFFVILLNLRGEGYRLRELIPGSKHPKKDERASDSNFESHSST